MVIDMLVQPMLYGEIYTPGDEPDGFGFWEREFGMGHMGPMDWDELVAEMDVCDVRKSVLVPLDVTTACGGHFGTNDQVAALVAATTSRWFSMPVCPGSRVRSFREATRLRLSTPSQRIRMCALT